MSTRSAASGRTRPAYGAAVNKRSIIARSADSHANPTVMYTGWTSPRDASSARSTALSRPPEKRTAPGRWLLVPGGWSSGPDGWFLAATSVRIEAECTLVVQYFRDSVHDQPNHQNHYVFGHQTHRLLLRPPAA